MKPKPVRVCDISRVLRISSASLISFLEGNGYSVKGDFRSPLSARMVELIQNGYNEGPPYQELNSLLPQAEEWEKQNPEVVSVLHTPPPKPVKDAEEAEEDKPRQRRPRKPKLRIRSIPKPVEYPTSIELTDLDLELIQQILELEEAHKIQVRDYFRRKTLLKAIAKLD